MKVETPKKRTITLEASIVTVCVDLSKNTFHVVALDADGKKILRKKFNRENFKAEKPIFYPRFLDLPAHYWFEPKAAGPTGSGRRGRTNGW